MPSLERLPSGPGGLEYMLEHYHVIILGDVHPQDLGPEHEQFMAPMRLKPLGSIDPFRLQNVL